MDTRIILFAASALLMGACSSNDPETPERTGEIRLYTEVAAPTRAAEVPADLQDTQFAAGTNISVIVTDNFNLTNEVTVTYPLQTYTADGAGGLTTSLKQYYPASGNSVNICAYHPYDAPQNFSVKADQRSTANYRASDLMWAVLNSVTKDTPEADRVLRFNHKFSKVVVRLLKGEGVTDAEMSTATITLGDGDLIMDGLFNPGDGSFVPETTGTGTLTIAKDAGTSQHAAVVIPQVMTNKKLTVVLGGGTKDYLLPAITFQSGKRYTYTITVNKAELVVTTEIADWTTVLTESDTIYI